MKELDRVKVETILSKFPNLSDLLENDIAKKELGYKSIAVGTFDHWLSYEEYDKYLYMFDDQDDDILISRAKTIASFPTVCLYRFDEELDAARLFMFEDKGQLYRFVLNALRKEYILTFCSYEPNMFIRISPDLTDMYYLTDSDVGNLIIERAHGFNLKAFIDDRE